MPLTCCYDNGGTTNVFPQKFTVFYSLIQISGPHNFNGHVGLQGIRNEYGDCKHYLDTLSHTAIKMNKKLEFVHKRFVRLM